MFLKNCVNFLSVFVLFISVNVFAAGPYTSKQSDLHESSERKKNLVDFDVSGSAGNYNGQSYTEVHAGLNLNFTDWLTWRNSIFKRLTAGSSQELTGLDSSIRLEEEVGPIKLFAGPGYRWASDSTKNAFLGEAGASIGVGRISLGVGGKYLRYDQAQYDAGGAEIKRDDFSYFVTISGGAGLSF